MQVQILGGVEEYGRSCFYLSTPSVNILLDCGILKDKGLSVHEKYPALTPQLVQTLDAVLLTHSHEDHCGALPYLIELGFQGKIYSTQATKEQLQKYLHKEQLTLENRWIIIEKISNKQTFSLDTMTITWGKTGHLLGSVWYLIHVAGKTIFYSGDFAPESILLEHEYPPLTAIDLAIVDAAYGTQEKQAVNLDRITLEIETCVAKGGSILFPVPVFGRGHDLLTYLVRLNAQWRIPIIIEAELYDTLAMYQSYPHWLKKEAQEVLMTSFNHKYLYPVQHEDERRQALAQAGSKLILSPDGMMEAPHANYYFQALAPSSLHTLILTGHQAQGTFGERLLTNPHAYPLNCLAITYKIHQDRENVLHMLNLLRPAHTILFHGHKLDTDATRNYIRTHSAHQVLQVQVGDSLRL